MIDLSFFIEISRSGKNHGFVRVSAIHFLKSALELRLSGNYRSKLIIEFFNFGEGSIHISFIP